MDQVVNEVSLVFSCTSFHFLVFSPSNGFAIPASLLGLRVVDLVFQFFPPVDQWPYSVVNQLLCFLVFLHRTV